MQKQFFIASLALCLVLLLTRCTEKIDVTRFKSVSVTESPKSRLGNDPQSQMVEVALKDQLIRAAEHGYLTSAKSALKIITYDEELKTRDGEPLLIAAIKSGNTDLVELFFEKGANPRTIAKNGQTALDVAKAQSNPKLLQLVKERIK